MSKLKETVSKSEEEFLEELVCVEETENIVPFEGFKESQAHWIGKKSKKIKVIFLDIDGVLNYDGWLRLQGVYTNNCISKRLYPLDPKKVLLLRRIMKKTGAKIVLSSSWRFIFNSENPQWRNKRSRIYKVRKQFNKYKIRIKDVTGSEFIGDDKTVWGRGYEIKTYLERHPEVAEFAILDDAILELGNYINSPNMFLTDFDRNGLTEEIALKMIKFLNKC